MSANRAGAEGLPASAGTVSLGPGPPAELILDMCDGLLGEIGRRMHRFSWLRDPSAPIVSYLPLDSYYPGNRIVLVLGPRTLEQERLCREQVPQHGLHLLYLEPDVLGGDRESAERTLRPQLGALGPLPERPRERGARTTPPPPQPRPYYAPAPSRQPGPASAPPSTPAASGAPSYTPGSPATPPAAPPSTASAEAPLPRPRTAGEASARAAAAALAAATHAVKRPERPPMPAQEQAGILFGIAMAAVLVAETLLLVILFALGNRHFLLAIGLAFDVCARGLGTVAATRENNRDGAWGCLIFGSPAVASFALFGEAPSTTEPAPLGGALAAVAMLLCGAWLVGAILGV